MALNSLDSDPSWLTTQVSESAEEYNARKSQYYAKIATKYPVDSVVIGSCTEVWEDYITNRICAVIEYPVETPEFQGVGKVECQLSLSSLVEVTQAILSIYENRVLVVDKVTHNIIAAFAPLY